VFFQVSSLDDVKTVQTDSNAAKTIALDHLGVIAAHLRASTLKFRPNEPIEEGHDSLRPLEEVGNFPQYSSLSRSLVLVVDIRIYRRRRVREAIECAQECRYLSMQTFLRRPSLRRRWIHYSLFYTAEHTTSERSRTHSCHLGPGTCARVETIQPDGDIRGRTQGQT